MITNSKIIEIFCAIDEFCKNFDAEIEKNLLKGLPKSDGKQRRNRKGQMCESEIMRYRVSRICPASFLYCSVSFSQ